MMADLFKRGEDAARDAQRRRLRDVADQMRAMFGSAAVEFEEAQVLVTGRGMIKHWLIDPSLRFYKRGIK